MEMQGEFRKLKWRTASCTCVCVCGLKVFPIVHLRYVQLGGRVPNTITLKGVTPQNANAFMTQSPELGSQAFLFL